VAAQSRPGLRSPPATTRRGHEASQLGVALEQCGEPRHLVEGAAAVERVRFAVEARVRPHKSERHRERVVEVRECAAFVFAASVKHFLRSFERAQSRSRRRAPWRVRAARSEAQPPQLAAHGALGAAEQLLGLEWDHPRSRPCPAICERAARRRHASRIGFVRQVYATTTDQPNMVAKSKGGRLVNRAWMTFAALTVAVGLLGAGIKQTPLAGASAADGPVARAAAPCSDYPNQKAAQEAADTRDADGDGIYCVIYSG
jgi:hypothetical protein